MFKRLRDKKALAEKTANVERYEQASLIIQKAGCRHDCSYLASIDTISEYERQVIEVVNMARALVDTNRPLEINHEILGKITLHIPNNNTKLVIKVEDKDNNDSIY